MQIKNIWVWVWVWVSCSTKSFRSSGPPRRASWYSLPPGGHHNRGFLTCYDWVWITCYDSFSTAETFCHNRAIFQAASHTICTHGGSYAALPIMYILVARGLHPPLLGSPFSKRKGCVLKDPPRLQAGEVFSLSVGNRLPPEPVLADALPYLSNSVKFCFTKTACWIHIETNLFISLIFCDDFLSVNINYDRVDHFSRSRWPQIITIISLEARGSNWWICLPGLPYRQFWYHQAENTLGQLFSVGASQSQIAKQFTCDLKLWRQHKFRNILFLHFWWLWSQYCTDFNKIFLVFIKFHMLFFYFLNNRDVSDQ